MNDILNMAKRKLTPEQEEEVVKRVEAGESYQSIADDMDLSKGTISNVMKRGTTVPKARTEVLKTVVSDVTNEAVESIEDVLDVGRFAVTKYKNTATAHGLSLKDFIDECIHFWTYNKGTVKDAEAKAELYRSLLVQSVRLARPNVKRIQQQKFLERVVTTQIMSGKDVSEELIIRALDKIWGS